MFLAIIQKHNLVFCNITLNKILNNMKTKISLSIIAAFNLLQAAAMLFFAGDMVGTIVNSDNIEVIRMCEVMHYALAPALLIIGLILLLCRNAAIDTAKNILLAYILGVLILMYIILTVMTNEPLLNFSIPTMIPDIAMLLLAIFGYLKAK